MIQRIYEGRDLCGAEGSSYDRWADTESRPYIHGAVNKFIEKRKKLKQTNPKAVPSMFESTGIAFESKKHHYPVEIDWTSIADDEAFLARVSFMEEKTSVDKLKAAIQQFREDYAQLVPHTPHRYDKRLSRPAVDYSSPDLPCAPARFLGRFKARPEDWTPYHPGTVTEVVAATTSNVVDDEDAETKPKSRGKKSKSKNEDSEVKATGDEDPDEVDAEDGEEGEGQDVATGEDASTEVLFQRLADRDKELFRPVFLRLQPSSENTEGNTSNAGSDSGNDTDSDSDSDSGGGSDSNAAHDSSGEKSDDSSDIDLAELEAELNGPPAQPSAPAESSKDAKERQKAPKAETRKKKAREPAEIQKTSSTEPASATKAKIKQDPGTSVTQPKATKIVDKAATKVEASKSEQQNKQVKSQGGAAVAKQAPSKSGRKMAKATKAGANAPAKEEKQEKRTKRKRGNDGEDVGPSKRGTA
jgi:hypothetical protein